MKQTLSPAAEGIRKLLANGKQHKALREREKLPPSHTLPSISAAEMKQLQRRRSAARIERIGPTPERLAKGDLRIDDEPGIGRRYRPKETVVDKYEGKWRDEVEMAFKQLVKDSMAGETVNVTMNLNGAGGRSIGSRIGGINARNAEELTAYHRANWIMDRLNCRSRRVIEWLLIPRATTEPPITLEEVGRYAFPHFKDGHACRMLGLGYFLCIGDRLVELYSAWNMEVRVKELIVREMKTVR